MAKEVTKFLKTRDVISPSRAYPNDAGIDFYVPKFNKKFIEDLKEKNPKLFSNEQNPCCINNGYGSNTITLQSNSTYAYTTVNNSIFNFDENEGKAYVNLFPQQRILIPAGIHSRMSNPGRALIASNKSGIATKFGLVFGAQTVDYSYKGEIHINVINTSNEVVKIYEDMKIIQFIETPVITNPVEVLNSSSTALQDFYKDFIDDRDDGGFGSTDKKDIKQINS